MRAVPGCDCGWPAGAEVTGDYPTRRHFAQKVELAGGLTDFLFGYGFDPDTDAPDEEVAELARQILAVKPQRDRLEELLDEALKVQSDAAGGER